MSQTRDKLKAPSAAAFAAVAASKQLRAVAVPQPVAVAATGHAKHHWQHLQVRVQLEQRAASRACCSYQSITWSCNAAAAAAASSDCGNMLEITFLCKLWQKENSKGKPNATKANKTNCNEEKVRRGKWQRSCNALTDRTQR